MDRVRWVEYAFRRTLNSYRLWGDFSRCGVSVDLPSAVKMVSPRLRAESRKQLKNLSRPPMEKKNKFGSASNYPPAAQLREAILGIAHTGGTMKKELLWQLAF